MLSLRSVVAGGRAVVVRGPFRFNETIRSRCFASHVGSTGHLRTGLARNVGAVVVSPEE